ncbi:MAG: ABC transporter ATP-binding protein [Calditrichaceae bacterium]|nr:ABC transporter ATP-binding protein [Calditrichaceae bacterium]MBN2708672.1 ABC transporter ATP-binding protein [Calditrichaceae bacterium]RQV96759.1 MAG: ABC transporter ATP-binding protein [Calditrichota bacterium]
MLTLDRISVTYENLTAVDEVSLQLSGGRIHGLMGANGAGKSSLINVAVGLINEYAGQVNYQGRELRKHRKWVKEHLGFAPEDTQLAPYLKGREFLELIAAIKNCPDKGNTINHFITMLGLEEKTDELICNLSHGMKQKILLASAFMGNPDYLIIDEALNGLDTVSLYNVLEYLQTRARKGCTILIASHIIPLIYEWCDQIHIMHKGKIIKQFKKNELADFEKTCGVNFQTYFINLIKEH